MSPSTVYRIESGEIEEPDLPTLRGLAVALDMRLSAFLQYVEEEGGAYSSEQDRAIESKTAIPSLLDSLGSDTALHTADMDLVAGLVRVFLRAARVTKRRNAKALLEELAVAVGVAADPDFAEQIKRSIRAQRRTEAG